MCVCVYIISCSCGEEPCIKQCNLLAAFPKILENSKKESITECRAEAIECKKCNLFRRARKLVIDETTTELPERIASARLITPYNRPRYYAAQHRARLFARTHKTQLLWVQCEDFPLEGQAVTGLNDLELARRRRTWIRKSDDKTGGIMGFMPLAKDLPMSCTKQLDKCRKINKHTQVTVEGWTLDPRDEERVRSSMEFEIMLEYMPLKIYVRKKGRDAMPQHLDLPSQIYAVSSMGSNWPLDPPAKTLWVRRFGFPLRPDFASTVHAVTGDELPAAIANLGHRLDAPNLEDALQGYISISRVSGHEDLRIAQPFSRALFKMGKLEIAHCMLDVLESHCKALVGAGEAIASEDLGNRLKEIQAKKKQKKTKLIEQTWPCYNCGSCYSFVHYVDDVKKDDTELHDKIYATIEKPGSQRRCKRCKLELTKTNKSEQYPAEQLVCSKANCGDVLPIKCFLDLVEERICVKCSGMNSSWQFTCAGACGETRNVNLFDRLKLCAQLLTLRVPLDGWDPGLPCLMCDADAWTQKRGKNFTCPECGPRPFEEFLINEQKFIVDRNFRKDDQILCGKCLLPECSMSGCTNKSPKAIYRWDRRESYVCNTCQEEGHYTCTRCKRSLTLDQFPEETQQQFKCAPGKSKVGRLCFECEAKKVDRKNFPCVDCGIRPFTEFLNNEQKRINDGKYRFNLCGRCLLPVCSLPGCTNRSPKPIYGHGNLSGEECRKQYICDTCQSVRCAKCNAPAQKKIKGAKFLQGNWYCGKKV